MQYSQTDRRQQYNIIMIVHTKCCKIKSQLQSMISIIIYEFIFIMLGIIWKTAYLYFHLYFIYYDL